MTSRVDLLLGPRAVWSLPSVVIEAMASEAMVTVLEEDGTTPGDVGMVGLVLAPSGEDAAMVLEAAGDPSVTKEATAGAMVEGDDAELFWAQYALEAGCMVTLEAKVEAFLHERDDLLAWNTEGSCRTTTIETSTTITMVTTENATQMVEEVERQVIVLRTIVEETREAERAARRAFDMTEESTESFVVEYRSKLFSND
ncbi:hypothetical protein GUJ93_ZPchr0030g33468 [Zizania palustris]|uniref:Uncharacterized protein n=1 Tax=Zizania palustris TaxID=103762 RepID=A0A8J5USD6_ZIZPA|nr:hypothetical protein GUJ93_ZPchr0030g33468 [Zizania palustris]